MSDLDEDELRATRILNGVDKEIEVGEYVRTDNGIIGKYVKYRGIEDAIETNNKWIGFDIEKDIVNHNKNIKELIEIGDYINGIKVTKIFWDKQGEMLVIQTADRRKYYNPHIIHNIVTKEQFASMEYKVKE